MHGRILIALTLLIAIAGAARAADEIIPENSIVIAETLASSVVRVEYELQYDKGEAPESLAKCPGCGGWHGSGDEYIKEERPMEVVGYVLSPTQVITGDTMLHPRFIKALSVRLGEHRVPARITAYGKDQKALFLTLDEPLKNCKPLEFDPQRKESLHSVTFDYEEGIWVAKVEPAPKTVTIEENGRRYIRLKHSCIVVDKAGVPVGIAMKEELPLDDSWKGSPTKWDVVKADEMAKMLENLTRVCDSGLLHVKLNFRSPAKSDRSTRYRYGDDDENAVEQDVLGLLLNENTVAVAANLKPKVTARLERILVYPPKGDPIPAKFAGTLADYGGLIATLEKPLQGAPKFSQADLLAMRDKLMLSAKIVLRGDNRVCYYQHERVTQYEMGWKRNIYPELSKRGEAVLLFDANATLAAIPIARRSKVTLQERNRWSDSSPVLTPVAHLAEMLVDLPKHIDPDNVPLTEADENRLAWMGVELQGLDRELARANNVSEQTKDGEIGALVSYIYPESPAAKAGVQPGYVLLRLHVQDQPAPLEVKMEDEGYFTHEPFPWDKLDQVSEEYYDQIPNPWPAAENSFTRALTDIGFGKKYTAEFFFNGEIINKDFLIEASPAYFNSASRFNSKSFGLTVRDLTFEVRRYFQRKPEDPGVIVSKVEQGSKASISGIKPYEIVTHVNDTPVMNVADFEKLVKDQAEPRLSVKRMTRDREVKIKMKAAEKRKKAKESAEPDKEDAEPDAPAPAEEP